MSERNTHQKDGELIPYKMGAVKIEAGNIVGLVAGFAQHAADTAGVKVVGVADETVDNTGGSAGDKTINVRRKKAFKLANSATNALLQADVGDNCYVEDSVTVSDNGATNDIVAGELLGLESDGVWVAIG